MPAMLMVSLFFGITYANVEILDYTNAQIITINTGSAKIQTGTFKLIQVVELEPYQTFINELTHAAIYKIGKNNNIYPMLQHEIAQLQSLIHRLMPSRRAKHSINIIGTIWKWIGGSPDHDDFEIIHNKVNNLLSNNNKQIIY